VKLLLPVLALLAGCAATPPASAPVLPGLGQRLLHEYLQPRTGQLQQSTAQLQSSMQEYCARPGDAARRTRVEQQLGDTVASWASVEFLRFGPLVEQNRLEHFYFWPDPRGVVQRQMRTLLAAADPALLQASQLQQQSAAVQGLPALEYALYADDGARVIAGNAGDGQYRCAYVAAVAANLARLATEIAAGWEADAPFALEFAQPGPARSLYRSSAEVATETLKTLSTALHAIRDQKLVPALGENAGAARSSLLPLYRSELTTRYLAASIGALAEFHAAARFSSGLAPEEQWIDTAVADELRRAQDDLAALPMPASRALADEEQRELLVHASLVLANARAIVDEYLAAALGVNLGFNSLDGD
jgi:predicted lipoprotein